MLLHRFSLSVILLLISTSFAWAKTQLDSLYQVLDTEISLSQQYVQAKKDRIQVLKNQKMNRSHGTQEEYIMNRALYEEYKSFISDSAIHYLNLNIDIAEDLQDRDKINEASIESASLFVRLGMYKEAADLLESIDHKTLNPQSELNFNICYRNLYLGLGQHTQNSRERVYYWQSANKYDDWVKALVPSGTEESLAMIEKKYRLDKKYNDALQVNDQRLQLVEPFSSEYAFITFHRSLIYRLMGDKENERKYLILSAISDIRKAIKDNASISILASNLMQEGEVERAYKYIRFSLENIKFYNTHIRSTDILNIQSIIDKQYQQQNEKKRSELILLLAIAAVLLVLLVISIFLVYKHMKQSQAFSKKLKENFDELESFNEKLNQMNSELTERNFEVAEANHIKEEYIVYLLDECSNYILKLDDYRDMVGKKVRNRQYEELYKITRDNTLKDDEYKLLFSNFDTMFLHLFPNFIEKLNNLLLEDEQIVLKKGEVLNTELRIFALIRLGITDSSKIAKFLGYSVNTIYNYRTKMKNKSKISRENFEAQIKKIGAFS